MTMVHHLSAHTTASFDSNPRETLSQHELQAALQQQQQANASEEYNVRRFRKAFSFTLRFPGHGNVAGRRGDEAGKALINGQSRISSQR